MKFQLRNTLLAVTGALLLGSAVPVMADSTDDIINALISKGVLTEEEGALLMKGRTGEKEAAEKKKKTAVSGKFKDGISFETGDGENKFSVNGRIQLDYRNNDIEGGTAALDKVTDTFDIRRAYLGAKGTFAKYYDFEVTADFASQTNTSHLDVAYMNIHWWDQFQLQFGQFKMPFSLEERTSSRFIDFQERSFVNNSSLTPGKERGIMIHGTPVKGVNYALAFSTGQGKNTNDVDQREESNDIIAHIDTNVAEIMERKDTVIHLGASYGYGDLAPAVAGAQRTEGRGVEFFTASAPTGTSMERRRAGFETSLAFGPVKFQGEYSRATFEGVNASGASYDKSLDAHYIEALWLVTGENYADAYKKGKYDRIKPKNDFSPDFKGGAGAWEIGVRYSDFDASDFTTVDAVANTPVVSSASTKALNADALTLGVKWLPTANARIMLNYVKTDFDTPITAITGGGTVDNEKVVMMRAQYDF